ncbi:hypothetical protein DMN91_002858 [Ooceraea biroi]|uniref:Odorant receptor n=1 Tax=Ooceraea biroi TaxID=2015173 RepID=A0A026VYE8_OOCBI|nr:odorant receptor 13a isoform X2 [Ooceraea biroi]EZA47889.1 hypothetical protein X777_15211 [Ooceraea biroi]RLU24768.1 hypothetical protein DMN91_002858 [Ooceraea biroi]
MDKPDQFFFQNTNYRILRILLSVSGLWPFHTLRRRYLTYLVMVLVLGSGFVFQVLGIVEVLNDTFAVIDTLPLLVFVTTSMAKMFCVVYALPQLKILLIKINEYCLSAKSDEEAKIHNKHAIYARNLGYAYTGFILIHSVLFIMVTLMLRFVHTSSDKNITSPDNSQVIFVYRVDYMVDLNTYYIPIFIHTATCSFSTAVLIIVFDVLYLTMVGHCCGLFAAVKYRLENAVDREEGSNCLPLTLTKDISYANVAYCVRRHAETIEFVAAVESMYSLPLFVHIGESILGLSVLGYQVVTNMGGINNLLRPASYLNGLLINVFFENWQGQKIIDFSEKIFESAYNTKWYNMSIATRKLLIIIMMKSRTPLVITAGKIMIMSYVTFNAVLRASSSYFMLLRSL